MRPSIPRLSSIDRFPQAGYWKPTTPQREARRARIVLHRITGLNQERTALAEGVTRPVVVQWEKRFREQGIEGLREARRSGRKSSISDRIKEEIITEVTRPPKGFTQWSSRKMARAKGVSPKRYVWKAEGQAILEKIQRACAAIENGE
ncbi:MAG: helix-turn-helix domain-containing protein [Verrucomicrobia bacterium]|nr:helix-turn-helix domain-containing protein [Verrucomicrobiota bacterium]